MVILAREFLDTGRVNVDTIDDLTIEMEMTSVMTTTTLSDTGYTKTELEQVLLVSSTGQLQLAVWLKMYNMIFNDYGVAIIVCLCRCWKISCEILETGPKSWKF